MVIRIINQTFSMSEKETNTFIQEFAQKLKIFVYELKIWISAYSIIFHIEKKLRYKSNKVQYPQEVIIKKTKEGIVQYLQANSNEKKYRIRKIANTVFEYFDIEWKCIGLWLN